MFLSRPASHVHVRLAREIRLTLGPGLNKNLSKFIEDSILSLQNIVEEVQIDQKYQSIEIMGFIVSKQFTLNLYVVILSIAVTLYQFMA